MLFKLSDGTQYERRHDGSWRRNPAKVNGRERKRLRKLRRRALGKQS